MTDSWLLDFRYVVRVLAKSRGFTAVAVLSLAIGIGANASIYGILRVLLFDPMPVPAPGELSLVYWDDGEGKLSVSQMSSSGYDDPATGISYRSNVSYPIYASLRDQAPAGARVAGFNFLRDLSVSFDDQPAVLAGGMVADGRFYQVVQPGMALGRPLAEADDIDTGPFAVVLSHRFWMRVFGGDPAVLNRTIRVNGVPAVVVGVTAKGFIGLSKGGFFPQTEITLPLRALPRIMPRWQPENGSLLTSEEHFWVRLIARASPAVPGAALTSSLNPSLASHLAPLITPGVRATSFFLVPGARGLDQVRSDTRRALLILMGVVGVVLLIACVNLAGLMLARGVARQREIAVRRALGAGRARLVRQLLLEGVCLALAGGGAGLLLTFWGRRALTSVLTAGIGTSPMATQPLEVPVDASLVAWTMGLSLVAALACSLLPALRLTGARGASQLGQRDTAAPRLTVGRWLIALQIGVSVPLLVGAVLFLRTLSNLGHVQLGFDPQNLVFFKLDPVATGAPEDQHAAIYRDVLSRLEAVPGVTSVTLMENVFLSGITSNTSVTIDGERRSLWMDAVGPDFLRTMGMRLLAGRVPGLQDGPGAPRVAALNETAARMLFGNAPPVGQVLTLGSRQVEIVGVVSDALYDGRRQDVRPTMYDSALQRPGYGGHNVVIRSAVPPATLESAIRRAVAGVHRDLPVPEIRTQLSQIDASAARERVFTQALTIFGGFALLLASIGLHGVTAYAVSRRRGEIGVRMALGAQPRQVLWLILRQVVVVTLAGLAVGVPLAWAVTPAVQSLLYGVAPTDVLVIAAAAFVMLMVAVGAGYLPARRAASIDPLTALRTE
ncbi:MAG: ABC transporter permease [Vicinamibacterales bacterium]